MGSFDRIAEKFTEKPGKKMTRCKGCNNLCYGYPVEKWEAPLIKTGARFVGSIIGGVHGVPSGSSIGEIVGNKLLDLRLKNSSLIVYQFECEYCNREFFRLMPDEEFYYEPTEEEEKINNKENRELLKQALDKKYGLDD